MFTVAQAKALRDELPGAQTKNLFLKDKKGVFWLVVALEDRRIDLKELRRRIGSAPLSFAGADVLREVLGVDPGSVTPFALINDKGGLTRVVLDAQMMAAHPVLNFHPLANTATTAIRPPTFSPSSGPTATRRTLSIFESHGSATRRSASRYQRTLNMLTHEVQLAAIDLCT